MKVHVVAGQVEIKIDGLDVTTATVLRLARTAASLALALAESGADAEPEPERPPLGFTAHIERLPEEILEEPYYDEED